VASAHTPVGALLGTEVGIVKRLAQGRATIAPAIASACPPLSATD